MNASLIKQSYHSATKSLSEISGHPNMICVVIGEKNFRLDKKATFVLSLWGIKARLNQWGCFIVLLIVLVVL